MSEEKPKYILSAGQPSIEERYGGKTTRMTFTLPVSMHEWLSSKDMPAAEYLRRLIQTDMQRED